jgi:hypothetical protein
MKIFRLDSIDDEETIFRYAKALEELEDDEIVRLELGMEGLFDDDNCPTEEFFRISTQLGEKVNLYLKKNMS